MEKIKDYEKIELFGIDIVKLYDCNLDKSYNLVSNNTDYLNNISKDEVKEIRFSYYKDIIILLKDGEVIINGVKEVSNIVKLFFLNATDIFAISKDKMIIPLITQNALSTFINNNNYKYKKIITNTLSIVVLTYDNDIRAITPCLNVGIDYTRYNNVDDIGYAPEDDEFVIFKENKIKPLFLFSEDKLYNESQVVLDGEDATFGKEYYII